MNVETIRRRIAQEMCKRRLARTSAWEPLQEYLRRTKSTGCGYIDYWHLWAAVRQHRPMEILELGTGASTIVLAHAAKDYGGIVTSMEESAEWFAHAKQNLPAGMLVNIVLSETVEDCFGMFRGIRYKDVPTRPYDFVFVDGPSYRTASGEIAFDFDLIRVIQKADKPLHAIIDKRVSTCFVMQRVLPGKVRYVPHLGLGFVEAASRTHLRGIDQKTPSSSFSLRSRIDFHAE